MTEEEWKVHKSAYDKKRYAERRDLVLAENRERRRNNPDLYKRKDREKYLRRRDAILNQKLEKAYGITKEDVLRMLEKQNGQCAICGTSEWKGKHRTPCVDHCHETGKVRALLCNECNTGIGKFQDNPDKLRAAATYLERHRT